MREIESYQSVQTVFEGLSTGTHKQYKIAIKQYLQFRNSEEGVEHEITPDKLIEEAKGDIELTQRYVNLFYKWLQGKKIKDFGQGVVIIKSGKRKPLKVKSSTAYSRAYANVRGFYTNNDIAFKKAWKKKIPQPKAKQAIKQDDVYTFYKVDERKKEIYFDREPMRQFLSNLKIRDQAITLALLSSAQDTGDLFKLNVGDIRKQSMSNRIYWTNTRSKTGVLFKTFFSKEATKLTRRYLEQERSDAQDDEPLFTINRDTRMHPTHLSSVYRDTARKIGIKWSNGEQNPLRPKRMRHLFRTACDTAGVTELYTNMFMGHKNSIGMAYSEVSRAKAELEYLRVEPFLTIYGEVEETTEIKEKMSKLETTIDILTQKNAELTKRVDEWDEYKKIILNLEKEVFAKREEQLRKEWREVQLTEEDLPDSYRKGSRDGKED